MSGNENGPDLQYQGTVFNSKGHQGGDGADFFNSLPPQQAAYHHHPQQQTTPGQLPASSMNPAFQPQGPPVFYNPMDYQKPVDGSLPVSSSSLVMSSLPATDCGHQSNTPWQEGQPHPTNGMDAYQNQNWDQSATGYMNNYPNGDPSHGGGGLQYGPGMEGGVVHGWQDDPQAQQGMVPQHSESWNYSNPQAPHNPHMDNGQGYQQQAPGQAPYGASNIEPGHNGYPGDQPTALNTQGGQNLEADEESLSSGGGFSGFFHDGDDSEVDLVHPTGKETTGRESSASVGLSGPDIIPAPTHDMALDQGDTEHAPGHGISSVSAVGGIPEHPHLGALPDLGQRPPQSHDHDIQQPQLGLNNPLNTGDNIQLSPAGSLPYSGQGAGKSEPRSSAPLEPRLSPGIPPTAEIRESAIRDVMAAPSMPEIVEQSSPLRLDEGHGLADGSRSQSSDLLSDIQNRSMGPKSEAGPLPVDPGISSPLSSLPSAASGCGDTAETTPPVDPQSRSPKEQGRIDQPPSGLTGAGVGGGGSHPDLSATVPLAGQVVKPDLTNIDHLPHSPTGPSSLNTFLPMTSDIDTSHTSAFRSISGRHTPKQTPVVNPSPPLWSANVPPATGNILLAPALSQPSIMPVLHPSPVKLQPRTAPSSVSRPAGPVPIRATAEALGPSQTSASLVTGVDSIPDRLGTLQVGPPHGPSSQHNKAGNQGSGPMSDPALAGQHPNGPPTSQPTFEFGQPYQPTATTSTSQAVPQASTASLSQSSATRMETEHHSGPTGVPSSSSSDVQPMPGMPDNKQQQQMGPQGHPSQVPGGPGDMQHPQHQQYPPYGGHGAYNPRYGAYAGGYDRYGRPAYGPRTYETAGRPADQYPQQPQYGRHSPYKQGPGWYDYGRQSSVQSVDRPPSRQAWAQQQSEDYQRYYKDREEYARRDEYYRQWYQQQRGSGGWPQKWWRAEDYRWYYHRARQAQQARNYSKEGDQSSSDWRDQSGENVDRGNRTNEGSFSSEFHHAGGGTPDQYGPDQSKIQEGEYPQTAGYPPQQGEDSYLQDRGYQQGYDSYQQELSSYPEQTQTVTPPPPERTTPSKFGIAHVVARFSPGGHLIKVLPNTPADGMPATVEIHRVEDMLEESEEAIELKSFPGPLIRGETHKSDVIGFATKKARDATSSTALSDRESVALLWQLMELLCRQNGTVLETDISELLLQVNSSKSEGEEDEETSQTANAPPARNIQKDTEQFRRLLLYGRKKESLEFAMKAKLWGHALLLAGKMDARTHASVMTRFANSLEMNDPLQTLYQLMSDRQPAAVTSCADEKWGDWRPHLAMILSNLQTSDSEVGVKSITALGDSLATRGLLHASHFCYLMAQVGFGPYTHKATKIVLLGSSHRLPFNEFATNMVIQLTEVYEYAQLLGNRHYLLPNFQAYKFLYATRLAGHGMLEQALHYCEVIAASIQYKPEHYSRTLVEQVCELANRLKYHDTQYYDGSHLTEPQWLTELQGILKDMKDGTIQPPSKSETPVPWVESCSNFSTMEGGSSEGQTPSTDDQPQYPTDYQEQYQYDQQWGQQQQYQEHGGHVGSEGAEPTPTYEGGQGFSYNPEETSHHQGNTYAHQHWQYGEHQNQHYQGDTDLAASGNSNFTEYSATTGTETAGDTADYGEPMSSQKGFDYYDQSIPRNRADSADTLTGAAEHQRQRTQSGSTHRSSRSRTMSAGSNRSEGRPKEGTADSDKAPARAPPAGGGGGGWFSGFFNKIRAKNSKEVHLPDDNKQDIVWDETKNKWVNTLGGDEDDSVAQGPPPSDHELSRQQTGPTPGDGPAVPPPGINKFSRNLSIGKYVDVLNKDTAAPTAPVPSTLLPPMQSGPPGPVNFYIPDSAPDGNEQPQIIRNSDTEPPTPNQSPPEQTAPQYFNPGNYGAGITVPSSQQLLAPPTPHQENLSHSSSMSSLSEEVSNITKQNVKEMAKPVAPPASAAPPPSVPGAPLMFNPSQMAQPASFPTPGASKPSRYGGRRQYPAPR